MLYISPVHGCWAQAFAVYTSSVERILCIYSVKPTCHNVKCALHLALEPVYIGGKQDNSVNMRYGLDIVRIAVILLVAYKWSVPHESSIRNRP